MRYAVVIEKGERNYSAYVPDLPGCVSVGDSLDEVKAEIRAAIEFHLEGNTGNTVTHAYFPLIYIVGANYVKYA
jgi:predicted RNase H-like HicB family nuclease